MLVALRRLTVITIVVIFVVIAAVLAYGNPEPISVDIGVMRIEEVSLAVTLALTFVFGAIFGAAFSVTALVRHSRERRALRRELSRVQREFNQLRRSPSPDAD